MPLPRATLDQKSVESTRRPGRMPGALPGDTRPTIVNDKKPTPATLHPAVAAMAPLDNDGRKVKPEGLDLDDDTPLTPVCDLSGEGTCEACQ